MLVVEDDEDLRDLLLEELEEEGYRAAGLDSAAAALRFLQTELPDVVLSDLRLPGEDGFELLRRTQKLEAPPAFIMITAFGTVSKAVEALQAGASDFLTKPLDLDHLKITLARVMETRALRRDLEVYRELLAADRFHGMIGESRSMQALFARIRQVAGAGGRVLILGESGVGKELVARAIHEECCPGERPFLPVNCAGIPAQLMEAEFFGHVTGAYTGASRRRKGLFLEAAGGSLFLDEISEMPPSLQAKLLRVLEDGRVRAVGSDHEEAVEVRILAASNRDLEELARSGEFRRDLFYRLETFTLRVPPLRERGADLELLAMHFLRRFALKQRRGVEGFSPKVMDRLRRYPFPGNVRELRNAVERSVAFCDGREIELRHLPRRIREYPIDADSGWRELLSQVGVLGEEGSLPTLSQVESAYIRHVLEKTGANKREAARILQVSRRTLYRRLDALQEF